jgi:hypothetical protein
MAHVILGINSYYVCKQNLILISVKEEHFAQFPLESEYYLNEFQALKCELHEIILPLLAPQAFAGLYLPHGFIITKFFCGAVLGFKPNTQAGGAGTTHRVTPTL